MAVENTVDDPKWHERRAVGLMTGDFPDPAKAQVHATIALSLRQAETNERLMEITYALVTGKRLE